MFKFTLITIYLFVATFSFSQDTIVKVNGEKSVVRIVEISESMIKYKEFSQPDGPIRSVLTASVQEIIFENGEREIIGERKRRNKNKKIDEFTVFPDVLHESGLFFEIFTGYSENERYNDDLLLSRNTSFNISTGIKLGYKWYFGERRIWRPGIKFTLMRYNFNVNLDELDDALDHIASLIISPKNFSMANIGIANTFRFSQKIGLEVNLTAGYNLDLSRNIAHGLAITPEVKFRTNWYAFGVEYHRVQTFNAKKDQSNWNALSLIFGMNI